MQTISPSRPLYESKDDLANEAAVAFTIERQWKCRLVKLSIKYGVDYAVVRHSRIAALAEVKCRAYSIEKINTLGGYMLSAHKWSEGRRLADSLQIPFILFVRFVDQLYWARLGPNTRFSVAFGGRTDRGDAQDLEPCVFISTSMFQRVNV